MPVFRQAAPALLRAERCLIYRCPRTRPRSRRLRLLLARPWAIFLRWLSASCLVALVVARRVVRLLARPVRLVVRCWVLARAEWRSPNSSVTFLWINTPTLTALRPGATFG